jgi:hypothetical protein
MSGKRLGPNSVNKRPRTRSHLLVQKHGGRSKMSLDDLMRLIQHLCDVVQGRF